MPFVCSLMQDACFPARLLPILVLSLLLLYSNNEPIAINDDGHDVSRDESKSNA